MKKVELLAIPVTILLAGIILLVAALSSSPKKEETPQEKREAEKRLPILESSPFTGWQGDDYRKRYRTTGEELEPELFPELKKERKNYH